MTPINIADNSVFQEFNNSYITNYTYDQYNFYRESFIIRLINKAVSSGLTLSHIFFRSTDSVDSFDSFAKNRLKLRLICEDYDTNLLIRRIYLGELTCIMVNYPISTFTTDPNMSINVDTIDPEAINLIKNSESYKLEYKHSKGQVQMLAHSNNGYTLSTLGTVNDVFIPDNYSELVQNGFSLAVDELTNKNPSGRLTILEGPPGTGKSYFIKALITQVDAIFVYIPSILSGTLSSPAMLPTILERRYENKPVVLIMEDSDSTIAVRASDNQSELSELLNLSDGILGCLSDIRIIATTNAKSTDIDKAVLRSGRLSQYIEFSKLESKHAKRIYNRLTNSTNNSIEFNDLVLSDVYKLATTSILNTTPSSNKKRVGF